MLVSMRRAVIPELEALVSTTALVHTSYRVHVIHNHGVVCDDDLFLPSIARVGRLTRPVLTIFLAGRARIRCEGGFEQWLEAGDVVVLPAKALAMRQEGSPFRSIAIEWDVGTVGDAAPTRPDGIRLDVVAQERVIACALAMEGSATPDEAAARLAELMLLLRAHGVPFDPVPAEELIERPAEPVVRLSRALDVVLSRLAAGPSMTDLDTALGLSPRQINRVVTEFNRRYGFNALGWRDTRNRRRILVGATMMTAAGARTELVARALGYSSPTGFCHAIAAAGLPSPGTTAEVVARLR
jgi:AraC-like DNA-binding protein